MEFQKNGSTPRQCESTEDLLTVLAAEVDRQLVLDLGGEFLDGSGFENERPESGFVAQEDSNA